ncbi:MAG TPA: hypothetical protein VFJ77_06600 [Gaiellaceae bacterium]|nr:hypothetical protein [Gaiellaceae bacterium]
MRGVLHLIADDLDGHDWYLRLLRETVADVVAFAARWAAFEAYVDSLGGADEAPNR